MEPKSNAILTKNEDIVFLRAAVAKKALSSKLTYHILASHIINFFHYSRFMSVAIKPLGIPWEWSFKMGVDHWVND